MRARGFASLSTRARIYVCVVTVAGLAVLCASCYELVAAGGSVVLLVLMAMTVASGLAALRVPSVPIRFTTSDAFNILAAVLVGPAAGAINAALDAMIGSITAPKESRLPHRILFNLATTSIGTWLPAEMFLWLGGGEPLRPGVWGVLRLMGLLTAFGAASFLVNTGLVSTAVALQRGSQVGRVWREHFLELWVSFFGGIYAAALLIALRQLGTIEMLILIAPLPTILYVTLRQGVERSREQLDHLGHVNKLYLSAIEALAQAVNTKDDVTSAHTRRVQEVSIRLARRLGAADDQQIQALKAAALLHDVGKIGVPEHILNKPGPLTPAEFEIMKRHAPMGAEILSIVGFPYPVVPIVRHHHEQWTGGGYPDGLVGDAIPIGARILSVVDCFDALTSDRPYRARMADEEAIAILLERRGTMYDPRVVDEFLTMLAADRAVEMASGMSTEPHTDAPTVAA